MSVTMLCMQQATNKPRVPPPTLTTTTHSPSPLFVLLLHASPSHAPRRPPAPLHLPNPDQTAQDIRPRISTSTCRHTNACCRHSATIAHVPYTHRPNRAPLWPEHASLAPDKVDIAAAVPVLVKTYSVALNRRRANAPCRPPAAWPAQSVKVAGRVAGPRCTYAVDALPPTCARIAAPPAVQCIRRRVAAHTLAPLHSKPLTRLPARRCAACRRAC